jgi:ferredoxin-nitrite reductase
MRDVINRDGLGEFGELVRREFTGSSHFIFKNQQIDSAKRTLRERDSVQINSNLHLGIHPQRQNYGAALEYRYYVGVVLLLGRLTAKQISELGSIAARYGSGNIRLTPWQNVMIPDVRSIDLKTVQELITDLGLVQTATHPSSLLRACAGVTGCQFSATDTQADAIALSEYLAAQFTLDRPLNIHFSGCEKSCAQPDLADITLWGQSETPESPGRYRLEIGGVTAAFNQESSDLFPPERIPIVIGKLIAAYYEHRLNPQESFPAFANRQ